ncbi:AAA family ATPase [Marinobacter sp. X15-166B]|uniref:bifunctional aminoglycoside phosphotransferase/ATP-binding protein n=1 Tax=Marinobacter sp. X15-166B TaxID=1897620 RepID=UPI00085C4044|nr:bifunctional aminoglycoside phosphotransferase/ATP-binding protein [Marinobacter sp. X15-166B]OEY66519.1 hypothetical protein BG841_08650 [Marinobacter sp. X15-166B]
MSSVTTDDLILALQNPDVYNHPVSHIQVMETHISWVILTGDYAYKIKKPMDFGFLDFSTLDRRQHFCNEELRLNSRLAGKLYLEVLPITGSPQAPVLGGTGEAFEYAIRMRQFNQQDLFDARQEQGTLSAELVTELARQTALFHQTLTPVAADKPLGTPEAVYAAMQENFDQIRPLLPAPELAPQLDSLEHWTRTTFERHQALISQRREDGFVRECHGDLHLANITVFDDQVTVFDGIEFNEPFRWIDVINDLAFLLMDLEARREYGHANRVLNTYLEYRDDFDALALLPLYKAYRALVRAKIALFTMGNPSLGDTEKAGLVQQYRDYANLAESYSEIPDRYLLATCGLSASGKTAVSGVLANELGLIRLRSDIERKRLHGLQPLESSNSATGSRMYTPEASAKTYQRLTRLTSQLLAAGFSVIVDAASLKTSERAQLAAVAEEQGVPFVLVYCEAPLALRREWIRARQGDASEATEDLFDVQATWLEPLNAEEQAYTAHVHTEQEGAAEALADRIRQRLAGASAPSSGTAD